MNILIICSNGDVLSVLRIIKIAINLIRIIVPIILIISISICLIRAIKDKESDLLNKSLKSIVAKSIAAILVFMIPTFVNILANISSGDETYLSCLNMATKEYILEAYVNHARTLIELARATLNNSDYNEALVAIRRVKDEKMQEELMEEISDVREFVELRNEIHLLAKEYDKDKYLELKEKIEEIQDEDLRDKLLEELKKTVGSKGSLEQFILDPNDPLYRNLKHFDGMSLKSMLLSKGSSVEKLEMLIEKNVDSVGVGTREAPAVAALTLIETLAGYGYRINYEWGGKWHKVGINPNIGVPITPCCCQTHPDPDYCNRTYVYKGFDCSGFVNWSLVNGFRDSSNPTEYTTKSGISLAGKNEAVCDTGDVLVSDTHIVLVIKPVDEMKSYLIAESTGVGVKLSYYAYNNLTYSCKKINYSN